MNLKEKEYFEKMSSYRKTIKKNYPEIQEDINYFSEKIRITAKDALSEQISPNIARNEISDLVETINKLKKEFI